MSICSEYNYVHPMYNIVTVSAQYAPLDLSCGDGWVQDTSGGNCYKFNETPRKNWDDSRQACLDEGDGADMVSIHSQAEEQFVVGMYNVLFRVCLFYSLCIWITDISLQNDYFP